MDTPVTAIIMAPRLSTGGALDLFLQGAAHVVQRCAEASMPVVLVAPAGVAQTWDKAKAPEGVHVASLAPCTEEELAAATLRAGVQVSAKASGWMFIPADLVMLRVSTLHSLCAGMQEHLIVHATHDNQPRLPMGFGAELFSELIHLDSNRALLRLLNRYPTHAVEVDDPGVRMHQWLSALPVSTLADGDGARRTRRLIRP